MTNRRLWIRFVVAVALAGVIAGARSGMHASPGAGFPTLPDLKHGEGDDITIAVAALGFPNVTYTATGMPPGITMTTAVDVNGHVTGLFTGTLPSGVGGTDPVTDAGTYAGSEGVYTVTVQGSDGSASNPFTWDIGRWGSGDVFVGAGLWTYQVYSKDGDFKYDVKIADINNPNTWGNTTGCSANWKTGEVWATNFDDISPAVNVITRHAAGPGLPYTDETRRLATDWYLPVSPYSVDINPENVAFDNAQNMWVGNSAGLANAGGDAADVNGNAIWLFDPPGAEGYVVVDATGTPLFDETGSPIYWDTWVSPDGFYQNWDTGSPVYLLDALGDRIPARTNYGGSLLKFAFGVNGYSNALRSAFQVRRGASGVDETEILSDSRTFLYSSESQYIYRFDLQGAGTQLPVLGSNNINAPQPISPRITYGMRALPPGDGSGGFLIANEVHIDRVDENGRIVQGYDIKDDFSYENGDVNGWFSVAIAPDGRSFWAATRQDVYRFDIASGAQIGSRIHATDGIVHTAGELAGLCIMNEYRAAQESCGVTGFGNTIDDDEDGVIDEGCFRIEICSITSPGDDDGDGFDDYNDPDCGAPESQQCASAGPTDASVVGFCNRANAEGDVVSVLAPPLPCVGGNCATWAFNYTATGLPPGLTIDSGTGEITGSPLYSIVNPNSASSPAQVYSVTIDGTWTPEGGTAVHFSHVLDWTIYNTNRMPVAVNDSAQVLAGASVLIDVKANDSDIDGDPISLLTFTQPASGTVTQVGQQFQYTAPVGFTGVVTFTYQVEDNYAPTGASNVATVTVVVNGPPVARNDSYEVLSGTTLTVNAASGIITNTAGSDSDPEGQPVTVVAASVTSPGHGSLTVNANGSFTYTPAPGFSGTDSFTYRVTDGVLLSNVATVTILVNAPPVAVNDAYSTFMSTPLVVNALNGVLHNDSDPAGGTIRVVIASVTAPSHGIVVPTASGDGSFVYTPVAGYVGIDTFTYRVNNGRYDSNVATVTITIRNSNRPPVAQEDFFTVDQGALLSVPAGVLVSNDADPDGDLLTIERMSTPTPDPGTLFTWGGPDGSYQFRSSPTFFGETTFTYRVTDPYGGASAQTLVHILVNAPPVAVNDAYTTAEDTTLMVPVATGLLPNDTDPNRDPLQVVTTTVTAAAHGAVTANANGTFTYVPNANYHGTDTFTYQVTDGRSTSNFATVTITITPVNDLPVAVNDTYTTNEDTTLNGSLAGNDTASPDGGNVWTLVTGTTNGTVTVNTTGTFTYVPNANFNGTDTFTYTLCDIDNDCSTATATITITAVNDAPTAVNDAYVTAEDTPITVPASGILANDTDPERDVLTVSLPLVTLPSHGALTQNADGSLTYTPALNYTGTDSYTYRAKDSGGLTSNIATVTITITPVNDPPVAVNDAATTPMNTAVTLTVLTNDSDPDGDVLAVTSFTTPTSGTVTQSGNQFVYTPATGFFGTATFTYTITDGHAGTSTATVTITIPNGNRPPVAVNDAATTMVGMPVAISVLGNDSDPDGDVISVVSNTVPAHGTVTRVGGVFTYTPASGFTGIDTFTYTISDGRGGTATATVTITVSGCVVGVSTTYTQGGWGANPNGNNPGALLAARFATVYPLGVQVGGARALKFTSAAAVAAFLPQGGTAGVLSASATNPTSSAAGVLAGQVLALQLNVDFSTVGITKFGLGNQIVGSGKLAGYTVAQVLALANAVMGGGALPTGVTISDINGVADSINQNYDNGTVDRGYLRPDPACGVPNRAPVAVNDTYATAKNAMLTITSPGVKANDSDPDGDAIVAELVSTVTHGMLALAADGSFIYTPTTNYVGVDSFTYKVKDTKGVYSNVATVTITITAVVCNLEAKNDAYTTNKNHAIMIAARGVMVNDQDPYGRGVTVSEVNGRTAGVSATVATAHGTVKLNADGSFVYTPAANYTGADSFTYKIKSAYNNTISNVATVSIAINGHYDGDGCDHDRHRGTHRDGDACSHDRESARHYAGDSCDHDRSRNGHHSGDGCAHDRDTHRHYANDGCDHERSRNGHRAGDGCSHDTSVKAHYDGDRCDHDRRRSGHKDGDNCTHDRDTRHHNDGDNCDHDARRNGHTDGDKCEHDRDDHGHNAGDGCDHDRRRNGHYDGDECEHDDHANHDDDDDNNPCIATTGGDGHHGESDDDDDDVDQHHSGDYCDHDRDRNGHRTGDGCEHDRITRHSTGDGCDHDRRRNGHYAGDRCDHDRAERSDRD